MHYHLNKPVVHGPITVIGKVARLGDDYRVVKDDLHEATRHVGAYNLSVSADRKTVKTVSTYYAPGREYLFIDGCGDPVDPAAVMNAASVVLKARKVGKWELRARFDRKAVAGKFRTIAIPGTGRRGGGSWFRAIRTNQEIRENDGLLYDEDALEHGVKVRGRRKRHNLPNSWDDISRSYGTNKSWKEHRKSQWKA